MRRMPFIITFIFTLFTCLSPLKAQDPDLTFDDPEQIFDGSVKDSPQEDFALSDWRVTANTQYSDVILDYDENITSKAIDQLLFRKNGVIHKNRVYISGLLKGSYIGEWTDTDSAFPILTRFPDHSGTSAHRFFIDQAALAFTATPADWLTVFAQLEYHDIRFDSQDEVQLRKAYATIGDLNQSPLSNLWSQNHRFW